MEENTRSTPQGAADKDKEQDFIEDYANSAIFEAGPWDLKIVFGQLDQRSGAPDTDWHTAITIPWPYAKVLSYYLQLNIVAYEAQNGKIAVPEFALPPEPPPLTEEAQRHPKMKAVYDAVLDARKVLLSQLK